MVSTHFKIGKKLMVELVFRHRFEKHDLKYEFVWDSAEWKAALWYKKMKSRMNSVFSTSKMFGFEFFIFKTWIKFERWK